MLRKQLATKCLLNCLIPINFTFLFKLVLQSIGNFGLLYKMFLFIAVMSLYPSLLVFRLLLWLSIPSLLSFSYLFLFTEQAAFIFRKPRIWLLNTSCCLRGQCCLVCAIFGICSDFTILVQRLVFFYDIPITSFFDCFYEALFFVLKFTFNITRKTIF